MAKTKRLGDLLVEAGLVTRLDIDQALQAQHIFGDRLGTNLVEMGVIDGDTLAGFLAQQYGVERVSLGELQSIPKEILEVVPSKAAHRLCILPIHKAESLLTIAMMDPSDNHILERIEKNVGMKIQAKVATEVEIRYFLEKYYGIRREMRHIRLMNKILEKRNRPDQGTAETDLLTSQLDRFISPTEGIKYFFDNIASLEKIPSAIEVGDLTKFDLTPELTFLLLQIDGLSNLHDFFSVSPFPRVTTLRAISYLAKSGLIRFEEP